MCGLHYCYFPPCLIDIYSTSTFVLVSQQQHTKRIVFATYSLLLLQEVEFLLKCTMIVMFLLLLYMFFL